MKRSILLVVSALMLLALPAVGQRKSFQVVIPFDFSVENRAMPAGQYLLSVPAPLVIRLLQQGGGGTAATIQTASIYALPGQSLHPRLVFNRYGQHRFLTEVWIQDASFGHVLFASSSELEYAKKVQQQRMSVDINDAAGK